MFGGIATRPRNHATEILGPIQFASTLCSAVCAFIGDNLHNNFFFFEQENFIVLLDNHELLHLAFASITLSSYFSSLQTLLTCLSIQNNYGPTPIPSPGPNLP